MNRLRAFFRRRTGGNAVVLPPAQRVDRAAAAAAAPEAEAAVANPLDLDEDLFTALGAQIGGENEELRNLLLEANAKAGELDAVRTAIARLIDPVSKALRAFEAEKSEKIILQTVLDNTRTAYGRLRNETAELENRLAAIEQENETLRLEFSLAQNALHTAEEANSELMVDLTTRKVQIAELESRLAQESGEAELLRETNRRQSERLAVAEKRMVVLESDLNTTRQRLLTVEDERNAQQVSLEKASAEIVRLSRKLDDTEAALTAMEGRLSKAESDLSAANGEADRLQAELEEVLELHKYERTTERMRSEVLEERATASETLLFEAREELAARSEELRQYDRLNSDLALERDALSARLAEVEAEHSARQAQFQELEEMRSALFEQGSSLTRAFAAKDSALAQAEETIASLNESVAAMEQAHAAERSVFEQAIEELTAALKREKKERAAAKAALESTRKDFDRLIRELMTLQRTQNTADDPAGLKPANAA